MSHDPVMHAMLTSTWLLLTVPCAFVLISVLWYRRSMDARAKRIEE